MMDIQLPFIFVSIFSLACLLLIFVYKFGIKEKSYEEALAEQRQQTNSLLGVKPKSNNKDKKNKKTSKKVKEKITAEEGDEVEQTETNQKEKVEKIVDRTEKSEKKPHVEFKEVTVMKNVANKKQTKKEKMRPILVNKETGDTGKAIISETTTIVANHFEERHPKDEYELLRSVSTNSIVLEEKQTSEIIKESETVKQVVTTTMNGIIANTGKEKKKKKTEFNTLQQLSVTNLIDLIRKAELSKSEVQILTDILLNKQHDSPTIIDEWSEGKSDPVQKLKKQLAEKEKLLLDEQQLVISAQAKLKEIRSEHLNEKTHLQQKIRGLEELLNNKQNEASRNHQQIQQLQTQIKDEVIKYHKLRDELQIQRQQFEVRLNQTQESEVIISQLQSEVQELSSINGQLRLELGRLSEENLAEKERSQNFIVQLNSFQKELEQKRQIEDSLLKKDSEIAGLGNILQQKSEEVRHYHEELQKNKDETNKIVAQLSADLHKVQEENRQIKITHMNGSLQESKQREVDILNHHNELANVKSQLAQSEKDSNLANAKAQQLEAEIEDLKQKFEEQKSKNNELRTKNWKVMEALTAAESRIKSNTVIKTKSEEDIQKEFIQRLFPDTKNEEITNPEQFIRSYLKDCDEEHQLKLQLQHYKNVIDNTEKMLNKLQQHIEQEEINWRIQLSAKTAELDALRENNTRLASLELELKKEQDDKKQLLAQLQQFQKDAQNDSH